MAAKSERPRIEDLPTLEIVPVNPREQQETPGVEQVVPPEFVDTVWVWRPTKREKTSN